MAALMSPHASSPQTSARSSFEHGCPRLIHHSASTSSKHCIRPTTTTTTTTPKPAPTPRPRLTALELHAHQFTCRPTSLKSASPHRTSCPQLFRSLELEAVDIDRGQSSASRASAAAKAKVRGFLTEQRRPEQLVNARRAVFALFLKEPKRSCVTRVFLLFYLEHFKTLRHVRKHSYR